MVELWVWIRVGVLGILAVMMIVLWHEGTTAITLTPPTLLSSSFAATATPSCFVAVFRFVACSSSFACVDISLFPIIFVPSFCLPLFLIIAEILLFAGVKLFVIHIGRV